jgi:hypothetical protein
MLVGLVLSESVEFMVFSSGMGCAQKAQFYFDRN